MYLIDTSLWVDYSNDNPTKGVALLNQLLSHDGLVGIMPLIYTEILQGAKNQKMRAQLENYFSKQIFYYLKDNQASYAAAATIYASCRQQGITIRSTIDCLIAQCAIENELILLHNDRDFSKMARIIGELKQQYTGV
jgi:predicted nucleic acid-binding protein